MALTIKDITKHCFYILSIDKFRKLPFHNVVHTQEVIDNVLLISDAIGLGKKEVELILTAACFHDTGFSETYHGHEEVSKRFASQYLLKANYPLAKIERILSYIDGTKMPQKPNDRYAAVLCDADLFHLGTNNFSYRNQLLRKEWELFLNIRMSDEEWAMENIKFLEQHRFKTFYGKDILELGKQENLNKLKQLIRLQ